MKRIYCLFSFFLSLSLYLSAQTGLKPLASATVFQERLKKEASTITSIESDFTQEKYLDVFSEKIRSKGRFYYRQKHMIRMDYTDPLPYQLTINGQKLKIVSEGKSSIVNLGSNQMMNEMKGMLAACMVGNLGDMGTAYELSYFETPSLYVVRIVPKSKSVRSYIYEITISLDKKDMSVQVLRLAETEKDYTEYRFTHKKYNTLTTDEKFVIR